MYRKRMRKFFVIHVLNCFSWKSIQFSLKQTNMWLYLKYLTPWATPPLKSTCSKSWLSYKRANSRDINTNKGQELKRVGNKPPPPKTQNFTSVNATSECNPYLNPYKHLFYILLHGSECHFGDQWCLKWHNIISYSLVPFLC